MKLITLKLHSTARAFTLVEMLVALAIGGMVSVMMVRLFAATGRFYQRNVTEVRVRQNISGDFRLLESAIRGAQGADGLILRVNQTATTTTDAAGTYVSMRNADFAALQGTQPDFAIYYHNPTGNGATSVPEEGALYLDPDSTTAANPAADRKLFKNVLKFEVRQNDDQTYRLGLLCLVRGTRREDKNLPGNQIVLSSSIVRRAPPASVTP